MKTSIVEGGVRVTAPANFATVVTADVLVANGVVHVVDTVMLPVLSTIGESKTVPGFGTATETTGTPSPTSGAGKMVVGVVGVVVAVMFAF